METILYYIRDNLVGTHYFIYAFILLFFMFSIIGYLFKQKYAKFNIKLATSQSNNKTKKVSNNVIQNNITVSKKNTNISKNDNKKNNLELTNNNQINKPIINNNTEIIFGSTKITNPSPMPNNDKIKPEVKTMPNNPNINTNPSAIKNDGKPTLDGTIPEI